MLISSINYWLVHHPIITNFEWNPEITHFSSLQFLILTTLTYLSLTFLLSHSSLSPLPPPLLRFISAVHNLIILLLSLVMAVGCSLSTLTQMPSPHWIFCFPANQTPPRGPVFFWSYIFYLSKIVEFIDTLLIILSGSLGRLSFLHVYHHSTVLIMCYIWLESSQSLFPVALVTNASVHTVMYGYYLMCTFGIRPSWKRLVTNCQIVQFVFSFLVSGVMLFIHFTRYPCSGILGWCFNAAFNVSLLYLFIDFHSKNYNKKKQLNMVGDKDKVL
ncbi:elongation of fatty acids protein 3-like [Chenopodium quinoa]|uniref:elongation of fatty acids protein 3-like n=1 Tax=Chenopodium quinoa TaxID=63459 RepID=UPI000B78CF3D|nr:elongation of fatty acids protein 3-like [Chenopodium quinoa]